MFFLVVLEDEAYMYYLASLNYNIHDNVDNVLLGPIIN